MNENPIPIESDSAEADDKPEETDGSMSAFTFDKTQEEVEAILAQQQAADAAAANTATAETADAEYVDFDAHNVFPIVPSNSSNSSS